MSDIEISAPKISHVGYCRFDCPNVAGHRCYVPIRHGEPKTLADGRPATWGWNGSADKPSIVPSIDCTQCGWHGFITNGALT